MLIGQTTGIAAGQHRRQKLNAHRYAHHRVAEAQLMVDKERDHG